MPSRHETAHGPVIDARLVASMIEPRVVPGISFTTTFAARPVSSPKYVHHSCGPTASSPPQFTIVAGTLAAPSSGSVCALMSSWWIGLYGQGSQRVVTGSPATIQSRWYVGSPPFGPYDAFIRAMTTGRSNIRAHVRATASSAIFDIEYVGACGEFASPSGSVSTTTCIGSSTGRYTDAVDITSADFAARQCCSSSPVPSALTRSAWS